EGAGARRERGQAQGVEVGGAKDEVDSVAGVPPPAAGLGGDLRGDADRGSSGAQFAEDRPAPSPLLELERPKAPSDPLIERGKDPRSGREFEVVPPADEVAAKLPDDGGQTSSTVPSRDLPHPASHLFEGLLRDAQAHDLSWSDP